MATSLVIEQKEMDEEVDIFQVVRRIQTQRPKLLSSVVVSLMHLIYEKVIVGVIIIVNFVMILKAGSRNLMGPKTLPTIWGTYMKLVTKYQISAINSC